MLRSSQGPVLVPVDFSPHSEAALAWAADYVSGTRAKLVVLHVVHEPLTDPGYYRKLLEQEENGPGEEQRLQTMEELASQELEKFLRKACAKIPSLDGAAELESQTVVGVPITRIVEIAGKIEAQLIVMGSHGRTGLDHLLIGSQAENVVRHSPVPVTIVKMPIDESKEQGDPKP